jgi:hypothetical protein
MNSITSSSVPLIINLRASLNHLAARSRSRRFNCFNTCYFKFRFFITNTFTSQAFRIYLFLAVQIPRSAIVLAFHLHLLMHRHSHSLPVLDKNFQYTFQVSASHILSRNETMPSVVFSLSFVYSLNQRTHIKIDRIRIGSNNVIYIRSLKKFIEIYIHLTLNPTNCNLPRKSDCFCIC